MLVAVNADRAGFERSVERQNDLDGMGITASELARIFTVGGAVLAVLSVLALGLAFGVYRGSNVARILLIILSLVTCVASLMVAFAMLPLAWLIAGTGGHVAADGPSHQVVDAPARPDGPARVRRAGRRLRAGAAPSSITVGLLAERPADQVPALVEVVVEAWAGIATTPARSGSARQNSMPVAPSRAGVRRSSRSRCPAGTRTSTSSAGQPGAEQVAPLLQRGGQLVVEAVLVLQRVRDGGLERARRW